MFISKDIAGRGAYYVHVEALYYKLEVVPNNITFNWLERRKAVAPFKGWGFLKRIK